MSENMQQIVSRAEFAEMCSVSRAAVTKACKTSLKAACIGNRIDMAHPAAAEYRQAKESGKTLPAALRAALAMVQDHQTDATI
jgi:hypothetical protein